MEKVKKSDYRIVETEKGFYIQRLVTSTKGMCVTKWLFFHRVIKTEHKHWHTIPDHTLPLHREGTNGAQYEPLMFKSLEEATNFITVLVDNLNNYPIYHYLSDIV